MAQSEIQTPANVIEAAEKSQNTRWYNNVIMKVVIFLAITGILGAIVWILHKMRGNIYLKRMQSLINSLANQKRDLKTKSNIIRMREDVEKVHQDSQQMEQGLQLLNSNNNQ